MGKTRVYQIARDVGLAKEELVAKINSMSLGFMVKNYMSAVTEDEAVLVREAVERERRRLLVEERIRPTVIRRRSRKRREPDAEAPAAEEASAPASAEAAVEGTPDVAEVAASPDVQAAPSPAEPVEAVDAEAKQPEVPDVAAEHGAVQEAQVEAAPEPAAEDVTEAPEAEPPKSLIPMAPVPAAAGPKPSNIAGFIDPEVIRKRLAKDNKTFAPGPARPAERRQPREVPRRKVVSQRDLYGMPGTKRRQARGGKATRRQRTGPVQRPQITQAAEHKRVLRIADAISVGDLAHEMGVKSSEIIKMLMGMGTMMTMNQALDVENAELVANEFGFTVQDISFKEEEYLESVSDDPETMQPRAPVVTVMGHVDHGKTSLLDAIRNTEVTSTEAGGITQHIGAYSVESEIGRVVFLDTPGHEAFTALRARGAKVTDLVVLVVAADDGVMPQTVEAINHSRAAETPIIVAVNKTDKAGANPQRVKQALTEYDLIPEEWGGSTIFVEVSALEGTNISSLLEMINLQAEILELTANPSKPARGIVLEAYKHSGRGTVATLIVQEGTLRAGDMVISGGTYGRVRMMTNERGQLIEEAGPSMPVEVTGLSDVPEAGESFFVDEEKVAKEFTEQIKSRRRQLELASKKADPWAALKDNKQLNIIIKADVQGSVEALSQSLNKLSTEEVEVNIIHSGVGGITENDVQLAVASSALIIGFNTRPESRATEIGKREGVIFELHTVIYDVIDRVRTAMTGLLEPIFLENTVGRVEVRETFSVPKVGTVAGSYVLDGRVVRGAKARLVRDGAIIYDSRVGSLRRFKDDVREVKAGFECGLSIDNYNDIKVGDLVEVYEVEEVAATLD